jgi:hypothetical protein
MTRWTRSDGWGVVDRPDLGNHGGRLYAAPLISGEITVLDGAAAVVTRSALSGADLHEIGNMTAAALSIPREDVDDEVATALLDELVGLGLLRRT